MALCAGGGLMFPSSQRTSPTRPSRRRDAGLLVFNLLAFAARGGVMDPKPQRGFLARPPCRVHYGGFPIVARQYFSLLTKNSGGINWYSED